MEEILIGSVDRTILVWIPDSTSTTGAGKTGLAHTAITVSYTRVETDNDVVNTDVTSSLNALTNLTDAHNDWGWKEVSATLSPGLYRLDLADALFAIGAWYAIIQVTVTTGLAAATPKAFKLVNFDMFGQSAIDLKDFADTGYDPATHLAAADLQTIKTQAITCGAAVTIRADVGAAAAPGSANGMLICGSNAATTFATITVSGATVLTGNVSMAAGLSITQSSSNASALVITGNGTGHGALITSGSGATGDGVHIVSAATNGNGIHTEGVGSGDGLHSQGGGTGNGVHGVGGGTSGYGIVGVATGATYAGIRGSCTAGYGIEGNSSNIGLRIVGDATVSGATTLTGIVTASNTSNNIVGIDVAKISGDATAADNAESFFDGTGYAGTNNVIPTVTTLTNLPSIPAGWITAAGIAADAIDADAIAADAVTEIQSGLATSANQTTILARLGAFTGSGVNTILGFFKALLSKTASTPSDVGGTFDPATDSTEAIRDRGDAAWTTATGFSTHSAADVWAVGTRILTAGTNIVLAKGVGVTGFNDIAATDVVSSGAITTSGGAVVSVTTTANLTTNNDKTGYALSATGLNLVVPADPSAIPVLGTASIVAWIGYFGAWTVNEVNSTSATVALRNSADNADMATHTTSDNGTTFSSSEPA